jgi:dolichol kinase
VAVDAAVAGTTLAAVASLAVAVGASPLDAAGREVAAALPAMALLAGATLALFALVELLDRAALLDPERSRKVAHVGAGGIALLAPLLGSHWPMLLLTSAFAVLLLLSRQARMLEPLHPAGRAGAGDLTYPAGIYAAFVLAGNSALTFQTAVLVLALADPVAALAGQRLGRARYRALGTPRSMEGSAAFTAVAFAVTLGALLLGGIPIGEGVARAAVVAVVTALAEALSPSGLDNLTIPVVAALALSGAFG